MSRELFRIAREDSLEELSQAETSKRKLSGGGRGELPRALQRKQNREEAGWKGFWSFLPALTHDWTSSCLFHRSPKHLPSESPRLVLDTLTNDMTNYPRRGLVSLFEIRPTEANHIPQAGQ